MNSTRTNASMLCINITPKFVRIRRGVAFSTNNSSSLRNCRRRQTSSNAERGTTKTQRLPLRNQKLLMILRRAMMMGRWEAIWVVVDVVTFPLQPIGFLRGEPSSLPRRTTKTTSSVVVVVVVLNLKVVSARSTIPRSSSKKNNNNNNNSEKG